MKNVDKKNIKRGRNCRYPVQTLWLREKAKQYLPERERKMGLQRRKIRRGNCLVKSNNSVEQIRTIVTPKETRRYLIVTDDSKNWHLVANQSIAAGESVASAGTTFHLDVHDVEFVDVILEETQERRRVYTAISAVPNDPSCVQTALEIPWCFMNHSCDPNTRDQWNTEVPANLKFAETVAARNIAEGEELTYDYDMEQYDYRALFECRCGVESCRGTIRGFSGLNREQKGQLLSHASPFVQERYRRESIMKHVDMSPQGRHLVIDYRDCDVPRLRDETRLIQALKRAAHAAGATVMSTHSHRFEDQGITAIVILAESHISIHTWPAAAYAGVDIYTCGRCDPLLAHKVLVDALSAGHSELLELARGKVDSVQSITAVSSKADLCPEPSDDSNCFFEGTVPGRRHGNVNHGFRITEVVSKKRTRFQEYLIFDNPVYGRVLVLDGIVQLSTADEHVYHEMLVHPPTFAHPSPRRVCIVGGGDGGTLREVLKHDPEEVVMIDIDEEFVRAAEEHLPSLSAGAFNDPRVTLIFEDASEALLRYKNAFDVTIIDCNDAMGPSEALFEENFYATVALALKEDSVCSVQVGSMLEADFLRQTGNRIGVHLGNKSGFRLTVPCYHCGDYLFVVASHSRNPSGPDTTVLSELQAQRGIVTKYWSPAIHHASQVLPYTPW